MIELKPGRKGTQRLRYFEKTHRQHKTYGSYFDRSFPYAPCLKTHVKEHSSQKAEVKSACGGACAVQQWVKAQACSGCIPNGHQFKPQLPLFLSNSPLVHLGKQQRMPKSLGPCIHVGDPGKLLAPGLSSRH